MTTTEGNKIIAEFMGAIKQRDNIYWFSITPTPDSSYGWNDFAMKYHSSWDWLMPAIKKFNDINPVPNFDEWDEWVDTINDRIEMNYDINEVFPAVVEAIQWYNENKIK